MQLQFKVGHWFLPAIFLLPAVGCLKATVYECGNGKLDPGEECELGFSEDDGMQVCRNAGYSVGAARCDMITCQWQLQPFCSKACDPVHGQGCETDGLACFYSPSTQSLNCEPPGAKLEGENCLSGEASERCMPGRVCDPDGHVCKKLCFSESDCSETGCINKWYYYESSSKIVLGACE